jgi:adenine-specific DNA-methyltransferase
MPHLHRVGKDKVVNHHHEVPYRVLQKQYDFGDTENGNMIIHGDNLEGLKSLLPQYEWKIKCIYIDPPYNTGNEWWVYNDNMNHPKIKKWLWNIVWKEWEDFNRHDKWLCMMYPRLKLLHKLLRDDGVIFISIDDNEQANLKLMMDEIFLPSNYIHTLIWKRKKQPSFLQKHIAWLTEYVLVYWKDSNKVWKFSIEWVSDDTRRLDNWTNEYSIREFQAWVRVKKAVDIIPKWEYKIKSMTIEFLDDVIIEDWRSKFPFSIKARFRNKQSDVDYYCEQDLVFITSNWWLRRLPTEEELMRQKTITNLLLDRWDNQDSEWEIKDIFWNREFDYSKPSKLILNFIMSIQDPDAIILDSFAWSWTTAHAVLNLNKADGWNRKFILLELMDYADTITAERVKRVINGYGEWTKATEWTSGGFWYYTLWEQLFDEEDNLNESIDLETIRQYIRYTETKTQYTSQSEPYFLWSYKTSDYYFYYEHDRATVLDREFLSSLVPWAEYKLIYADICHLSKALLTKHKIIFKKIPRDITRF